MPGKQYCGVMVQLFSNFDNKDILISFFVLNHFICAILLTVDTAD